MRSFRLILVMVAICTAAAVTVLLWPSQKDRVDVTQATIATPVTSDHISPNGNHVEHKAKKPLLPKLTPDYKMTLQGLLDAAQPANEPGRIIVKFCAVGRYGNEHFCGWVTTHGVCKAGFIQEDPANGTVPVASGTVPGLTAKTCTFENVFAWLRGD